MYRLYLLLYSCLTLYVTIGRSTSQRPINIVYTIDNSSVSYFFLSISSVIDTIPPRLSKNDLFFYIIVSGLDAEHASSLLKNISKEISCLKISNILFLTFIHPISSPLRLSSFMKSEHPHWFADTETIRCLIPNIIPSTVTRYIYLDNDTIMTKNGTIQKLWKHDLGNKSVGLVLNAEFLLDQKHIHRTYFKRDNIYLQKIFKPSNSSFLTKSQLAEGFFPIPTITSTTTIVEQQQRHEQYDRQHKSIYMFSLADLLALIPKFPNNGVMLVNATSWREHQISEKFLKFAAENIRYKFMAMGSQPYSFVVLQPYWTELQQFANLRAMGSYTAAAVCMRHRGKGVVHFAGKSKPHDRCYADARFTRMSGCRIIEQISFLNKIEKLHEICPRNPFQFSHCLTMKERVGEWCGTYNESTLPEWVQKMSVKCRLRVKELKRLEKIARTTSRLKVTGDIDKVPVFLSDK